MGRPGRHVCLAPGPHARGRALPVRGPRRAGVPLAFGSDSPVTALDPWSAVRAAMSHADPDQRISARAAFRPTPAAAGASPPRPHRRRQLRVGSPAHLAVWRAEHLAVQGTGTSVSSWSTDARSGTPCSRTSRTTRPTRHACRPCVTASCCTTRSTEVHDALARLRGLPPGRRPAFGLTPP
ncbi:amidohydrolase family protein [Oerskovia sp. M15]